MVFFANQGTTEDLSVVPRLWPIVAKDLVDRVVLAWEKERLHKVIVWMDGWMSHVGFVPASKQTPGSQKWCSGLVADASSI